MLEGIGAAEADFLENQLMGSTSSSYPVFLLGEVGKEADLPALQNARPMRYS